MIDRALVACLISLVVPLAYGQPCNVIRSDADRVLCYDGKYPRGRQDPEPVPEPKPGVEPPPVKTAIKLPRWLDNFKLANETAPSGALRSEPANFSFAKLNGEEYSIAQAALTWAPSTSWFPDDSYASNYGWAPFFSYSINRNSLSTKRADIRQGAIGLYGTLFRIKAEKEPGQIIAPIAVGMATKLEVSYRRNRVDGTESVIYTLDNWLVSRRLFDGIPYSDNLAWFVSPRVGLQVDDRRSVKLGSPKGETRAMFGQLKIDLFPGAISDQMKVSLSAQRYRDLSASGTVTKRGETFAKAGVEFLLYPPRLQNVAMQPSLGLERSFGADLLNGLPKQGLTQLVFKLKLN